MSRSVREPAYETIYTRIRQEILSGVYPYGAKLPGKRALADQFGVSVITVAHALEMLSDEGYLTLRERSGCYAAYRASNGFQTGALPETGVSDAPFADAADQISSADLEGFPFSSLARTMRRLLSEQAEALLLKSPNQGLPALRQAISRYLSRSRGITASPERIVIGAGAEYLYGLLADMLGTGRIWAIEAPSYEKIEQVYTARGVRLDPLPLGRDGLQSEPLWRTEASVLHLSPYRSYPSDVTASASKRAEYLRWGELPGRLIIEDDFESEFCVRRKPMDTLFSSSARENVIYLNTFSRTVSPSLRVAYMVLPGQLLPVYQQRAGFYSCTVSALEQHLLAAIIDSGEFERHIRRVRRRLRAASGTN